MSTNLLVSLAILLALRNVLASSEQELADTAAEPHWFLVPPDDLAGFEALEFAVLRINEMRRDCDGFHLAPLQRSNYNATQIRKKQYGLYEVYRLHISSINGLAPTETVVDIAKKESVSDLSLFQVIKVKPGPCDLYSELDDAELLVAWKSEVARRAKNVAMEQINEERKLKCPQRPSLQFIRIEASSVQPAQGKVVRLVLEMREASDSFQTSTFTDVVTVIYALDQEFPSQCNLVAEVYPGRKPCKMKYTENEESAESEDENEESKDDSGEEKDEEVRRLSQVLANGSTPSHRSLRELRQRTPERRLSGATDIGDEEYIRPYIEQHLDIPNGFDPRLKRTLCFPRGFSRQQGSCGASWAFAATAVASFRECLENLRTGHIEVGLRFMSAQQLTSCNREMGCSGGSASTAFYYMKYKGISRETCVDYRMRCFVDNSRISVSAANRITPKSKHYKASAPEACPVQPDPDTSPCKCLPSIFHYSRPVECELLPSACRKYRIPHYFKIAGTAEGNTIPQIERHMKQEMITAGPLYVSTLVFDDFYDSVSWTESGIYIHKRGDLIGKHAVMAAGWGTDLNGRDYWLLLNSFGSGWQQEGYFKVLRGRTSLEMMKFGAWGVDWTKADEDVSKPGITEVELAFSPVLSADMSTGPTAMLSNIWLQISAKTDENARVLVRVMGLKSSVTGGTRDHEYSRDHVLKIDLLSIGLIGERAKVQLWAADDTENTARWGPFTFDIPGKASFLNSQERRLASISNTMNGSLADLDFVV